MNKESYMSASTFPVKLLHNKVIKNNKIIPYHVQFIPTNRCNLRCNYCSCDDRDKKLEFTIKESMEIIDRLQKLGTKTLTITGGGEPMMYDHINSIIGYAKIKGIQSGLVTNGTALNLLFKSPKWCRISSGDGREPSWDEITEAVKENPKTEFAFSHVMGKNPNYETIEKIVRYANKHKFTHVRLVNDLLKVDEIGENILIAKNRLKNAKIDDSNVIYQARKDYLKGNEKCLISLLKPVISPDKKVYPCCGSQYAIKGQKKDMGRALCDLKDLEKVITDQKYFNGKACQVCYYNQYNNVLGMMIKKLDDMRFV